MNGLPYYKAYPRDFIEGTIGMPFELKGAYRLLLDLIYMQGGRLPDDAKYISGLLGCSVRAWNKYRSDLLSAGKIQADLGIISNFRADKELESLTSLQEKQREKASKPRKNNVLPLAPAQPKPSHTEPEPEPYLFGSNEPHKARVLSDKDSGFERFWAVYPLKKAKAAAEKNWIKAIKKTDPEIIIAAAAKYAQSRDVSRGFVKYAQGWLTDERWKDGPEELPIEPERHYGGHRRSAPWGEIVR